MSFGERLKEARKHLGLSQKEVAKIIHVDRTMIGKYENNECRPTTNKLISLVDLYRVDANYLLLGDSDQEFVSLKGLPNSIKQKVYFLINSSEI